MDAELEVIANVMTRAFPSADAKALREVFGSDAVIWHNHDRTEKTLDEVIANVTGAVALTEFLRYDNVRRREFDGGFLQQHTLVGLLRNGVRFEVEMCIVVRVEGGKVVRMDEYLDAGALRPVEEAAGELV